MTWDPRSTSRYQAARRAWLPTAEPRCCLCGGDVDVLLPAGYPGSPTVEHTLAIRDILAMTETRQQALDLACDTSLWATAHHRCQAQQGARATNARKQPRRGSRAW